MFKIFKKSPKLNKPINYPSGLMLKTSKGYYYVKKGRRYKASTKRIADSWNLAYVETTTEAVSNIPLARSPLGFRDGTLIHNVADGKLYLISDNKRRHITSPDVFERYGLKKNDIVIVSDRETNLHEEGDRLE